MDDTYILDKLKKWVRLFYGRDKTPLAYKRGRYYYFGYEETEDDFTINKLSKPVAIFLAVGYNSFIKFLKNEKIKIPRIVRK